MTYFEFVDSVAKEFIIKNEQTGIYYLDPLYMYSVANDEAFKDKPKMKAGELDRYLDLEVQRLNSNADHSRFVMEWLYTILNTQVDEAILNEENQLVKNVLDYMQYNDKLKDKEKLLDAKEDALKKKQRFKGFSFSKKEA